jgi:hypothetical protein
MPIITTTVIKDDNYDSEIQEIKVDDGKVCFKCYKPGVGYIRFALTIKEVGFFVEQLGKCAVELSKDKPDERYSGC